MNRLDWTQKDIDYHVLKWPTSRLHPRRGKNLDGSLELKGRLPGVPGADDVQPARQEGIGWGIEGRSASRGWRAGGTGQEGMAQEGVKEAVLGRDSVSVSARPSRQQALAREAVSVAAQPAVPVETYSAAYNAVYRVGQTVQKIRGRIQGAVGRLREVYLRQQKKTSAPSKNNNRYTHSQKEKQGTRRADRDEVLAMQSENHYLLDSYDRKGQYSMLGK